MKSEEKLKISYENQRATFLARKVERLHNIDKSIEDIDTKIEQLQRQRNKLSQDKEKIQNSSFRSWEEFLSKAREQSSSDKPKKTT